jgi:hypothetical protein
MGFFWPERKFLLFAPVMVEFEVPAIVSEVVGRMIPAIEPAAAGYEGPATVVVVAAEVVAAVAVCNIALFYIEVAGPEVGLRSVGLRVEEEVTLRT